MAILDLNGNPIDLGQLAEPQTAGTAWLHREWDTHPARGLTPAALAALLLNAEQGDWLGQLDLADDIEERDGHCFAELSKRKGSIAALEWDVVAPDRATATEKAWADQLREWMRELPDFEDVLLEMMDGVLKGASCHALAWKQEGRLRLPTLQHTPTRWFVPDAMRNSLLLRSATQMAPSTVPGLAPVMGEPLRPLAWMVHQPRSRTGYITRSSLVRVLAWPYLFKHYSTRDFQEFLEIFGLPLRLGKYPTAATPEEKMTLLQAVTQIGHNAAGIIPQGMTIDFEAAATGTHVPFEAMMRYMDGVQSKAILGQTLSSSEGRNGTQALGNVHEKVRMDIRATDARQVEGTVTRQLLVPMGIINISGFNPGRAPRFKLDLGRGEDVTAYAEALPKLAAAGMRIKVDWAHDKLRIPMGTAQDAVLQGPAAAVAPGATTVAAPAPVPAPAPAPISRRQENGADATRDQLAGSLAHQLLALRATMPAAALAAAPAPAPAPARDLIDDLVDEQASQWRATLGPLLAPLLGELDRAAAAGESIESFAARLPQLVAQMDAAPLADDLARAGFAARLAGEADLNLAGDQAGA
jgi:phage gp29-like protein